ncbi:hypothetical protein FF38_11259 [Lucilia cuprina]|uniref:Uncharacterized protein n=1 Tax=Lucilia cuprina TaxID=7375 RepID=A0A0L0BL46_LUCCU|nr:hypothetical protein CVS40_2264 [Lucilia cuprina]KNC20830.1 hypothetical protein FF38_11259 [Lucilia cuprina]
MLPSNVLLGVYFAVTWLCTCFEMTNSRTSTMWKLNMQTGKIQTLDEEGEQIKNYASLDEDMLYNFNAMADVYSRDETFFTLVSSTRIDNQNGWLRQSAESTLASLLEARKLKTENILKATNKKSHTFAALPPLNMENNVALHNNTQNVVVDTLDCGQPINYTNYDYIINLGAQYKHKQTPAMPEPDVIYFFLPSHDQEDYKNFNIVALEKRLKRFKRQNPISAELYHHIGNYWRIIGDPVQAIKCFRRSLDISPAASEVMYDLAKVLYNLQYLDDAIHMARRSIEFQAPPYTAWRQYLLLGDIMKTYGDLRISIHYYRLALELNPTQELILRSLNEAEQRPTATLHVYTIVIIVILVIMVLIVILTSMITEVRADHHYTNGQCTSNSEAYDVKPQRHFNRAMAMRSLKGLSGARSMRQRKY